VGIKVETRHLSGYTNAYDYAYKKIADNGSYKILHNAKIITELERTCGCRVTKQCESMMFLPAQMYHTITEVEFNTERDLTMFLLRWS
jgi:hypothetical protein